MSLSILYIWDMKTRLLLLAVFFPLLATAQQPCKVLLADLDSVYVGKCKNGLANGQGEAWGKFYYTGKFVDGYPQGQGRAEYPDGTVFVGSWKKGQKHGKGTMYLKENGKPVEKSFIWQDGVAQKEIVPPAYKIITQRNITRLRVYKQGEGSYVWFYPNSLGGVASDFQDVQINGSTGSEINLNPKLGYENVVFPFKGSIRFKTWNKLRTAQFEVLLEIEISQPGNWVVEIQN